MPTLGGCVALTWWVAHIMSGNDVPIITGTRVPLIWFNTKDTSFMNIRSRRHIPDSKADLPVNLL